MKVAAVQFRPAKGEWAASMERLSALITHAAGQGAKLIVCPEMAVSGYLLPNRSAALRVAEPMLGPTYQRLSELAIRFECYLVAGYPEVAPPQGAPQTLDGGSVEQAFSLYNAALVIGPDGALMANYRKRLLFEYDMLWAQPGTEPYPVVDTPLGSLTVGICMDLNDDRFIRFLHRTKPNLVAFCTNWLHEGADIRPYWRHRLRGAPCHFIAANTYGEEYLEPGVRTSRRAIPSLSTPQDGSLPALDLPEPEAAPSQSSRPVCVRFLGHSAVLDPEGETLALAPESGDAVLIVEIAPPL